MDYAVAQLTDRPCGIRHLVPRILINAATINVGGGIQIALGVIEYAATRVCADACGLTFAVSTQVFDGLRSALRDDPRIRVFDGSIAHPIKGRKLRAQMRTLERETSPDIVFSIGFPSYISFDTPEIALYTNGWDFCSFPEAWRQLTLTERAIRQARSSYHRWWARKAVYFQTQSDIAKAGIVAALDVSPDRVLVLPNSVDPRFVEAQTSEPAGRPRNAVPRVFCLSAAYLHKNLTIIPDVAALLRKRNCTARFVLTLPEDSTVYRRITEHARAVGVEDALENVGPLKLDDCVLQYGRADCLFFPTLAEIFSATYLEAMAMGVPIVTTDLDFARAVCGDAAEYYRPLSAPDAARAVESVLTDDAKSRDLVSRGRRRLTGFPDPNQKHEQLFAWLYDLALAARRNRPSFVRLDRRRRYQVCTCCVMDTTDSRIVFDGRGECDHCRTFHHRIKPHWDTTANGRAELETILARIRAARGADGVDCIVGVSGGTDSSYLTYLAKTEFGLNPLVFHVDTGWNSQESTNNIERLVDGLDLQLHTEVISWDEMRDVQLAFFKSGVPHVDAPQDHAIFASLYRYAAANGIRYILTGANYATECIRNPIEWMYYQSDSTQLIDIHRRFGARPLETFPTTRVLWHKAYLPYWRKIHAIKPLNYVDYHKQRAVEELSRVLGWEAYPQKHFESRFTRFYEGFWLHRKFGYDVRKVQLSSLILTGQLTRAEAQQILSKPPLDEASATREFHYVASKLEISPDELWHYFNAPNRTYRDYKSDVLLYEAGARFSRLLGLERGGKR